VFFYPDSASKHSQPMLHFPLDQFNGLMETVHLLKNPANATHLIKSIEQYHSGKVSNHELTND